MENNQSQLDPTVVNLAKSIRQTESNGNFQARGKSGEYGAYQFMPTTWKQWSKQHLGQEIPLEQATPAQQNEVAYKQLKALKDKGYNVGQIAAVWNSGSPDWEGKKGINRLGVEYDVPAYVNKVAQTYQSLKGQTATAQASDLSSTVGNILSQNPMPAGNQAPAPTEYTGVFGTNPNDSTYGKLIDNSITRGIQNLFPGEKIGQAIGTLGGYAASPNKEFYDTSAPTPLQVAGDVAQGALAIGTGGGTGQALNVFGKAVPTLATAGSAVGRIGQAASIGGAYTGAGSIAGGETSLGDIAKDATLGATLGGAFGLAGETVVKAFDSLPPWLLKRALPKLQGQEDLIAYANKNIDGVTIKGMVNQTEDKLQGYNRQIKEILSDPDYNGIYYSPTTGERVRGQVAERISPEEIMAGIKQRMPNSEYTLSTVVKKLKTQLPSEASTFSKIEKGESLSLLEANTLREKLDMISYKTSVDSPEVKAGKELAATIGDAIRTNVQTKAPETASIFSNYTKGIRLKRALTSAEKNLLDKKFVSFGDLLTLGIGGSLGGIPGAVVTETAKRMASSPATKINLAKGVQKVAPVVKGTAKAVQKAVPYVPGAIQAQK